MKTFVRAVLVLFILSFALPASALAANLRWRQFDNCTLIENEFNDGDSFHVRADNRHRIFRLYFVDSPETTDHNAAMKQRVREQAAVFRITPAQVIRAGKRAAEYTRSLLSRGTFTVYTTMQDAGGDSSRKRYFAYVVVNGKGLDELLVSNGWARVYGRPINLPDGTDGFKHRDKLQKLEAVARRNRVGAWNSSL